MTEKPTVTDLFNAQTHEEVVALVEQTAVANGEELTPEMKVKCEEHAFNLEEFCKRMLTECREPKQKFIVPIFFDPNTNLPIYPHDKNYPRSENSDWLFISSKEQDEAINEIAEMLEKAGCERVKIEKRD